MEAVRHDIGFLEQRKRAVRLGYVVAEAEPFDPVIRRPGERHYDRPHDTVVRRDPGSRLARVEFGGADLAETGAFSLQVSPVDFLEGLVIPERSSTHG